MGSNEVWRRQNGVGVASLIKAILSALAGVGVLAVGVVVFPRIIEGGTHPPVLRVPLVVIVVTLFGSIGTALVWSAMKILGTTRRRCRNEAWVRKVFAGRCPWCLENVVTSTGEEGVSCAGCGAPSIERASIHAECAENTSSFPRARWWVDIFGKTIDGWWQAQWTLLVDEAGRVACEGRSTSTKSCGVAELKKLSLSGTSREWAPEVVLRARKLAAALVRGDFRASVAIERELQFERAMDTTSQRSVPFRDPVGREGEVLSRTVKIVHVSVDACNREEDCGLLHEWLVDGKGLREILDAVDVSAVAVDEVLVDALLKLVEYGLPSNDGPNRSSGVRS